MSPDAARWLSALLGRSENSPPIDEYLDADRRAVGERVAEVFRWLFLIILVILNNLGSNPSSASRLVVNGFLVVWAGGNFAITGLLLRGYRPGRLFSLGATAMDLLFGAALIYFSNGFSSPYFTGFFLAIIASAVRFGVAGSIASAVAVVFIYLFVGGVAPAAGVRPLANSGLEAFGRVFLFGVVAIVTGLMAQELLRERRIALSHAAQADALRQVSAGMAASLDIKEVFEVILQQALRISGADQGRILVVSPDRLETVTTLGLEAGENGQQLPAEIAEAARRVSATGKAVVQGTGSDLMVQVAQGDGVTALLNLHSATAAFSHEHFFMVDALAASAATALANALSYHRRTQEAMTDGLTGLLNHREFRRQVELAFSRFQRNGRPFAMMLIDVDHFKSVNDLMGHQQGDEVLRAAADLVRQGTRANDLVARYGGDEMAVIMSEADPRGAAASGARLVERARVAQVATTPGHFLTFSVGVASCPDDAVSPEELIMAADQALYQAKRDGKDRVMSCGELVDRLRSDDDAVLSALAESGPQVMIAIAHTVDSRDPRTRGRSTRVAAIAEELAKQAGVPDSDLDELRTVALLHDVGLLEISPELACHDWPLTHGDADLVLRHAELGEQIVSGGQFPPQVANAVRHHHERWDGQGYPDHLAGRRIPLPARIVALSDALESVLSSRRGGEPPSLIEAFERLSPEAGRAFDPNLVDALRNVIAQGRLGSLALRSLEPALNTGA